MNKSICIITGSTLGGAEYVADNLNDVLSQQQFDVTVFNHATLADIQDQTRLLVITSTHGAGELPDNIKPLFEEIDKTKPDFNAMKFGVIGLGSSDYDTFCHAVNLVEQSLTTCGATQVCESLRIDVTQNFDHDGSAEEWLPNFINNL
ncbi:FMN-binding protein MioC [Glaesserella sp.]|uniref:FMN-binding protein MioC n=1 Tax=Glaesserella sp. TaxID=2094731 RepID=UPI00359F325B